MHRKHRTLILSSLFTVGLSCQAYAANNFKEYLVEDDLRFLKNAVINLEKRIDALEKEKKNSGLAESDKKNETSAEPDWKTKSAWTRLKEGMTDKQVEAILGHPSRIEEGGRGFKILYYHGNVTGSGAVSGSIELYENHVYMVHEPSF
jgi:hypothetical protein